MWFLFSPNLVNILGNHPIWWKIRWLTTIMSSHFYFHDDRSYWPTTFHQIWWNFWGITKFGEKSCVDTVTTKNFGENIFTKYGEIGVIHFNCWTKCHKVLWKCLGVKFLIFWVKLFSPNMVKIRVIHLKWWQEFH